jgi:hypothetical protein
MGILFESGPRQQIATRKEKQIIFDALSQCWHPDSFYFRLNMLFNNVEHFSNPMFDLPTKLFLKDVAKLVASSQDVLVVKGGIHQDPGHSSRVIYQFGDYHGDYRTPCWVQDTYIAFTIQLADKNKKEYQVLRPSHTYHFLIDRPLITKCSLENQAIIINMVDPYSILQDPVVYEPLSPYNSTETVYDIRFIPPHSNDKKRSNVANKKSTVKKMKPA